MSRLDHSVDFEDTTFVCATGWIFHFSGGSHSVIEAFLLRGTPTIVFSLSACHIIKDITLASSTGSACGTYQCDIKGIVQD